MVKNLPANAGGIRDVDSIPRLVRSPGGGHDNPLWAMVHRVTKSQTQMKWLSTHACIYRIWSILKKEENLIICDNMFKPGEHYTKKNKPDIARQILHNLTKCGI